MYLPHHNQNKLSSDHICIPHYSQMHIVILVIAPIKQQLHIIIYNHKWTGIFYHAHRNSQYIHVDIYSSAMNMLAWITGLRVDFELGSALSRYKPPIPQLLSF